MSVCLGFGLAGLSAPAGAQNNFLEIPELAESDTSPASEYANLTNTEAYEALVQRKIPHVRLLATVPGVRAPIRLAGKLRGISIQSTLPEAEWATTVYNILDARLALALDDLCQILAHHDIAEVVHFTMYRSPQERGDKPQFRHPGGLAIDIGALRKKNGDWLSVGPHWPGLIGAKTCGESARKLLSRRGRELVSILCEVADQRIFHYMLSPHYDEAHDDHWHLEIKPGVKWFLVN